jgi:hypothetical protein
MNLVPPSSTASASKRGVAIMFCRNRAEMDGMKREETAFCHLLVG